MSRVAQHFIIVIVILSFKSKALRMLHENGTARGLDPALKKRLAFRLRVLDDAREPSDMDVTGWGLHPLKGERDGEWAIKVTANWRLTFRFEDGHAAAVELEDYH